MFANRTIARFVLNLAILVSLFFTNLGITPVYAAPNIITVNTAVDEVSNNELCSLREAIINANNNAVIHPDCATTFVTLLDTINFAGNYTITLTTGDQLPTITSAIIIKGNGAGNTIIQANASPNVATYRVFEVYGDTANLTLDSLTVRHGRCAGGCYGLRPDEGGGIYNYNDLTVINSTISGNSATGSGGGISSREGHLTVTNSIFSGNSASDGGGVFINDNTVTMTNSTFSGNSATDNGGGVYGDDIMSITSSSFSGNSAGLNGGGIYTRNSTLTVTDSTFSTNTANNGGAIYNEDSLTVTNSTFSGNSASYDGGGVSNTEGILTVTNSTFSENSAEDGGGIRNSTNGTLNVANSILSENSATDGGGGISNSGSNANLGITDSTISGNSAGEGGAISNHSNMWVVSNTLFGNSAYRGGAIYNASSGNMWLANSTLSGNTAEEFGGGIYSDGGAWIHNSTVVFNTLWVGTPIGAGGIDGDVALYNSIVAGNTRAISSTYRDCNGTVNLSGLNAFWDTTNCNLVYNPGGYSTYLVSLSELGPLQDNGGPTWTHALLRVNDGESRVIDAGDNSLCAAWPVNNVDQRGVTRPQGLSCDAGAYEVPLSSTLLSSSAEDGWIRESSETSNRGGAKNNTAVNLALGDDVANRQYRSILSFDTSSLPDDAEIISVILRIKKSGITGGGNPVNAFKGFMVDIKNGDFGTTALALSDFKAPASQTLGPFRPALVDGWYSLNLTASGASINRLGNTQIRLRFKLGDNNNFTANILKLFSGNADPANAPQLIVEYTVP